MNANDLTASTNSPSPDEKTGTHAVAIRIALGKIGANFGVSLGENAMGIGLIISRLFEAVVMVGGVAGLYVAALVTAECYGYSDPMLIRNAQNMGILADPMRVCKATAPRLAYRSQCFAFCEAGARSKGNGFDPQDHLFCCSLCQVK